MEHNFKNFTKENLALLNKERSEKVVYGSIHSQYQGQKYITDVCYETMRHNGIRSGICLNLFRMNEDGTHGEKIASIYDVVSAKNFYFFVKRARGAIELKILALHQHGEV